MTKLQEILEELLCTATDDLGYVYSEDGQRDIAQAISAIEGLVPEEKQVEPVSYDYKGLKCPYCDTAIPNEEVYIWNLCREEMLRRVK